MRKPDRKNQLLHHAKHLFLTLGYQETTTERIALAADVSEAVLHRHFESKKTLFLEVLLELRQATLERWQEQTAQHDDPLGKLHAILEEFFGGKREHILEFRTVHRTLLETDDPEITAELKAFYLESEAFLAQLIGEGQQAGVFRRSLDPRVGAWELIRTALGYSLTLPLDIPLYQEPGYPPRAVECVLHCLLKTDV